MRSFAAAVLGCALVLASAPLARAQDRTEPTPTTKPGEFVTFVNAGQCLTSGAMFGLLGMKPCDANNQHQWWTLTEHFNHEPRLRFAWSALREDGRPLCMSPTYNDTPYLAANNCEGRDIDAWIVDRLDGKNAYRFQALTTRFGSDYCLTFEEAVNAVTIKPCGGPGQAWRIVDARLP